MREAVNTAIRAVFHLLVKLFILALWMCFKLIHEISGAIEVMLKKKLESS